MEKPPFEYPLTTGKICLSHKDGRYYAALDRDTAVLFLFDLHWLITDQPIGDDISLSSRDCGELSCLGGKIEYCEFHLIPEHNPKGKHNDPRRKPHGDYDKANDRLDYFVNPAECKAAYEVLLELLSDTEDRRKIREATIFDTLTLRFVNDG